MDYKISHDINIFPKGAFNCRYGNPYDYDCDDCATDNLASTKQCYQLGIRVEWGRYWKPNFVVFDSNTDVDEFIK